MSSFIAKVLIKDRTVVSRRVGDFSFQSQRGLLVTSPDEAIAIDVSLPRDHPGYEVGEYHIGGESFDRDQYQRPCFGKRGLHLVAIKKGP